MACKKPFTTGGMAFACGQCLPCRIKRRKVWAHRIIMESYCHTENSFLTLTYANDRLPMMYVSGCQEPVSTLAAVHLQRFLKRLRKAVAPLRFRFFGVGEYGDVTWRPHYHLILFGMPTCRRGLTRRDAITKEPQAFDCCDVCRLVHEKWGYGHVYLGAVNKDTAEYVAKYTIKKLTSGDDDRLGGRNPEFSRMSNRRGIGFDALWEISDALMKYGLEDRDDVPYALRHGNKHYGLGRYLREKLREQIGMEPGCPQATMDKIQKEMLPVWLDSVEHSESFSKALVRRDAGEIMNIEARHDLWKKRRTL